MRVTYRSHCVWSPFCHPTGTKLFPFLFVPSSSFAACIGYNNNDNDRLTLKPMLIADRWDIFGKCWHFNALLRLGWADSLGGIISDGIKYSNSDWHFELNWFHCGCRCAFAADEWFNRRLRGGELDLNDSIKISRIWNWAEIIRRMQPGNSCIELMGFWWSCGGRNEAN